MGRKCAMMGDLRLFLTIALVWNIRELGMLIEEMVRFKTDALVCSQYSLIILVIEFLKMHYGKRSVFMELWWIFTYLD